MSPAPPASIQAAFFAAPRRPVVLLVEDDDLVAGMIEGILSRGSRRVLRAANGAEAERLFEQHRGEITIAMLDCWLPDITGPALSHRLRRVVPALPILFTSGCDNDEARRIAAGGLAAFLPKPFYPAQVEREIAQLLGDQPRQAA